MNIKNVGLITRHYPHLKLFGTFLGCLTIILCGGLRYWKKLVDRKISRKTFLTKYAQLLEEIKRGQKVFLSEVRWLLNPSIVSGDIVNSLWWECLLRILKGIV